MMPPRECPVGALRGLLLSGGRERASRQGIAVISVKR